MKNITYAIAALLFCLPFMSHAQTISGNRVVCLGASRTVLTISTSGGAWSSGDVAKATIDASTGEVTGVAAGTATISYTILPATVFTTVVTVNAVTLSPIGFSTGFASLCAGSTNATCTVTPTWGNAWSSSNASIATVNTGGLVTPSSTNTGTVIITYHHGTGNCDVTRELTVNPTPTVSIITPVCVATTQTATATPAGGTWASSNTGVGTINTTTGVMTGATGGTTNISYTASSGCRKLTSVTVANLPSAISGTLSICAGNTSTLSSTPAGGAWSSVTTAVATVVGSTGVVTGVLAGTSTISYTIGGSCTRTAVATVNAALPANAGPGDVCVAQTITLTNATSGGTWGSSNTAKATVNSATGLVTGVSAGTANITYSIGSGCRSITTITVNATPAAITGTTTMCVGTSTALSHPVSGGTWASSNTARAAIGSSSGIVTGVTIGTATITYTISTGCYKTITITVGTPPASITGTALICAGTTTALACSSSGGTWSSSNTGIATVGSTTGVVTGVTNGTTTISYIITSTGCFSTRDVTVNATAGTISGTQAICTSGSSTLSSSASGGTWTSSNTSVATIGSSSGALSGIAAGTAAISYSISGGCISSAVVTVSSAPATITGTASVCVGLTTTLANTVSGGTWSSSNTSAATVGSSSGIVSGISTGTSLISYITGPGCFATRTATILATPGSITGTTSICAGNSSTLSSATSGGTWSSSNTGVATIGSSTGTVNGIAAGTSSITYTLGTGCTTTTNVTVNSSPASIGGTLSVCAGGNATLTNSVSGGAWSSSNTSVATVGSTSGTATGAGVGTATITYSIGSCIATTTFTVNSTPASITGTTSICAGNSTTLNSATSGGTWSSGNTGVATIGSSSGTVGGIAAGTSSITYALGTSCYTTTLLTVNANPASITGATTVCVGATTTLSNTTSGGTWSSSNTGIATIGSTSGIVIGISGGTATVSYITGAGCYAVQALTVVTTPGSITGTFTVCTGNTAALANATSGGTWSSSTTGVATIGSSSGVVTGLTAGTTTVSYIVTGSCYATQVVTVNTGSGATIWPVDVCVANGNQMHATITGGTWSTSDTAVASIFSSGYLVGHSLATCNITYTLPTGCLTIATVTVHPTPTDYGGPGAVCAGTTATFTCSPPGGLWSSSNDARATVVPGTGVVTGVSAGSVTISYVIDYGCWESATIGILPDAGTISGYSSVHVGSTILLLDDVSGGIWLSSNGAVASIGSTGVVTGIATGTATIYYAVNNECGLDTAATVITVTDASATDSCASSWSALYGNWEISTESANMVDIALNDCNVPYVAYGNTEKIIVKKYDGGKFVQVGGDVYTGDGNYVSIAIDAAGLPNVCFQDESNSYKATVKKYNGSAWVTVGSAGFSAGNAEYISLAVDNSGTPYVAYRDNGNSGKVTVMKFNGSSWVTVGAAGFSAGSATYVTLALDGSGSPYIAYKTDVDYFCKVMKFNGSDWDVIGAGSTIYGDQPVLAVDSGGTPYVSVFFGPDSEVRKYNGSSWVSLGNVGLHDPANMTMAMGSDNLPWIASSDFDGEQVNKVKKYNGSSWVSVGNSNPVAAYYGIAMAVGNDGNPYLSYIDPVNKVAVTRLEGSEWKFMSGSQGVSGLGGHSSRIAFDVSGVPYVALIDFTQGERAVARKYENGAWIPVGPSYGMWGLGISPEAVSSVAIAIDSSGAVYLAYTSYAGVGGIEPGASVKKFNGSDWITLGSENFGGDASDIDIALNSAGIPYVTYANWYSSLIEVKKFNGSDWVDVSDSGFIVASALTPSIAFDGSDVPYVSYKNENWFSGNKGSAVKFNGTTWEQLGSSVYCTPDTSKYVEIAVTASGTPYVVYSDGANEYRASVRMFDGSSWVNVGSAGFSPSVANYTSIALDGSGTPYVTFQDQAVGGKITVMKYDGSNWVVVGSTGISEMTGKFASMAIDGGGIPYVTYTLSNGYDYYPYYSQPMVMKFGSPTETGGDFTLCQGSSKLLYNYGGGTWSSSNPSVAIVNCMGLVTGISAGTSTITYTADSCSSTTIVTVNALPYAGTITGADTTFIGMDIALSASVTGGVWSSSDISAATVGSSTGTVTGVYYGVATISYSVTSSGCSSYATHPVVIWYEDGGKPSIAAAGTSKSIAFSVAPNPTTGMLTIKTGTSATLAIYTIDGRTVKQYEVTTGTNTLSLPADILAGIYMLRFKGNDGSTKVVRLVYKP